MAEEIQRGVREAITTSDDLSRRAHDARLEPIAQRLAALRTALHRIDQAIGGEQTRLAYVPRAAEVHRIVSELEGVAHLVVPEMRASFEELMIAARTLPDELGGFLASLGESREIPSDPLFGVLPLARVVPQDVHSLTDYVHAAGCIATALAADSVEARVTGAMLGASIGTVSALTDYRLSAAKVIPIEVHEGLDHAWGLAAIAAPFVLGYYKKDPAVAALHCLLGAGTILTSLFTDYRAARGVGRSR